ncbi:hypothetical protein [Tenacibaculum amylolyticum]|uniref:hypothetical protein n=1 Tax=Tenacibaculum amylolyticum TaxID=104269 RepID=UPI0038955D7D
MSTTYTKLSVENQTKESVDVYVTFAASNPKNTCCGSPATVGDFPVLTEVNKLMGKFSLAAGAVQEFDPQGNCFSGNICFYIEPQCPVKGASFNKGAEGTSIAEFTLNPSSGCDEAFDISCVNGVNSFIQIKADGEGWNYGPNKTPISTIYNKGLGLNSGNPGVFPVNCTDCIRLVGDAPCPTLPVGPAQTERICNIQRTQRGGTVNVILTDAEPA